MANNRTLIRGRQIPVVPTDGGVAAGDPCLYGKIPGVSLNGYPLVPGYPGGTPSSTTPQAIDTLGVYSLFVRGRKAGANSTIQGGDPIYYTPGVEYDTDGSDTPLSGDSTETNAVLFGYALGVARSATGVGVQSGYNGTDCVASGADTAIDVRLGSA
jgi:hypothetical protein